MRGVGRPHLSPICESRGVFFFFFLGGNVKFWSVVSCHFMCLLLYYYLYYLLYILCYLILYTIFIFISDILIYHTIIDLYYILLWYWYSYVYYICYAIWFTAYILSQCLYTSFWGCVLIVYTLICIIYQCIFSIIYAFNQPTLYVIGMCVY